MKKALFIVCFLASMVYGLERGATSNFKYIIDTGVQSIYVLQNRTGGYDLSLQLVFNFWGMLRLPQYGRNNSRWTKDRMHQNR